MMIFQGSGNQAVADLTEGISEIQKSYNNWSLVALRISDHVGQHLGGLSNPINRRPETFLNVLIDETVFF